ncbi:hypothetical protein [Streptomyces sp. LMG1-1-1.1]|uniref:hypothetical protein n=1 Tax=Streptomyces sp. LMG1-1-1.1 TaxID=3135245 RepID=UPI0034663631
MTTSLPTLVLRGRDGAVLRCEEGVVTLRRAGEELRIPVAAIGRVRAEARTVGIELTAPDGAEPTTYGVADVSEAAATAFAEAVNGALPEREGEAVDGAALVTTRVTAAPAPARGKALVLGAAVPVVALDVFVGVAGRGEYAVMFGLAVLVGAMGGFLVRVVGRGLYRMWWLPRHGITVVAELSHHTSSTRVYRYVDPAGNGHTYTDPVGGERIEVAYDPRDPAVAIRPEGLYVRCMMALVTVVGCGLVGGGLYGAGRLVLATLTER